MEEREEGTRHDLQDGQDLKMGKMKTGREEDETDWRGFAGKEGMEWAESRLRSSGLFSDNVDTTYPGRQRWPGA